MKCPLGGIYRRREYKDLRKNDPENINKSSFQLMNAIKSLLDLTNRHLKNTEEYHPWVAADFLALTIDTTSRAMKKRASLH